MKYTLYRENWKFVNTFVHCLYFASYPQKQHTKVRDYNVWLYKLTRNKDDKIFEKYLQFYSIISLCRWCCNIHFMSQTNLELCFFQKLFLRRGVGIPLTGLTLPHFCACLKYQVYSTTKFVQWKKDCYLTPNEHFVSHTLAEPSYVSMRLYMLGTRSTDSGLIFNFLFSLSIRTSSPRV
jgi:hypothetical protein